jgi:hypothetical protein
MWVFYARPLAVEAPSTGSDYLEVDGPEGVEGSCTRMPLDCLTAGVTDEQDARFSLVLVRHVKTIAG